MMIRSFILIYFLTCRNTDALENEEKSIGEDKLKDKILHNTEKTLSKSSEREKRTTMLNELDVSGQMLNSIQYTKVMKIPPVNKGDDEFDKKVCTNLPWTKTQSGTTSHEPTVEETTIFKHPYIVQIMVDEKFRCSGTLITRLHVITAAKCVVQLICEIETVDPERLVVRVGSTYLYKGGDLHEVRKVVTHPKYHWSTSVQDLSILTLTTCVTLSTKVKLAEIHPDCGLIERIEANLATQAPGWGFELASTYKSTTVLHVDNEYLYENGDCHSVYRYGKHKNHTYFPIFCVNACTGTQDDGLRLSSKCQGDVGGPVYYRHKYFIAVVLFRRGCLFPKYPTFSSVVCLDHEWIKQETNNLQPNCSAFPERVQKTQKNTEPKKKSKNHQRDCNATFEKNKKENNNLLPEISDAADAAMKEKKPLGARKNTDLQPEYSATLDVEQEEDSNIEVRKTKHDEDYYDSFDTLNETKKKQKKRKKKKKKKKKGDTVELCIKMCTKDGKKIEVESNNSTGLDEVKETQQIEVTEGNRYNIQPDSYVTLDRVESIEEVKKKSHNLLPACSVNLGGLKDTEDYKKTGNKTFHVRPECNLTHARKNIPGKEAKKNTDVKKKLGYTISEQELYESLKSAMEMEARKNADNNLRPEYLTLEEAERSEVEMRRRLNPSTKEIHDTETQDPRGFPVTALVVIFLFLAVVSFIIIHHRGRLHL